MMNKRTILECLTRAVLLETAQTFDISGLSGKKRDDIISELMRIRSIPAEAILDSLPLSHLKDICREYDIKPQSWRKSDIINAIAGNAASPAPETRTRPEKQKSSKPVITDMKTIKEKVRMPRDNGSKKTIEQYTHNEQERLNNPPVGLVTPDTDKDGAKKQYQYDPHLDPQLVWAGKAEHTSFEVPTVSLHVHERIDPKRIIEQVRKEEKPGAEQMSLFAEQEKRPLREAVEFYKHKDGWTNRLIAGDSLLVMNSLLEKEGMGEKVQMVYFDPPYGIKYGSNFQPFVNKRDVKDGKDEDLSSEPEMIHAFRDTWELGIHSYLTYLRDRITLAKQLLHESGSIFIQISDENVHRVRSILDEVFGAECHIVDILVKKKGSQKSSMIDPVNDYILWYSKSPRSENKTKFRALYSKLDIDFETISEFRYGEFPDNSIHNISAMKTPEGKVFDYRLSPLRLKQDYPEIKLFRPWPITNGGYRPNQMDEIIYEGKKFLPPKGRCWSFRSKKKEENEITPMERLALEKRLCGSGTSLDGKRYLDDFPYRMLSNWWDGLGGASNQIYVVQTNTEIIRRCMIMSSDPGDIILDITCGSGSSAVVAEEWGRRWITCDTSRIAITLAKQRLISSSYNYYSLAHPQEGVQSGFLYNSIQRKLLRCIANSEPFEKVTLFDQPLTDSKRQRITGPFTVEAVPAPTVKSFEEIETSDIGISDASVTRSGETLRQSEWRQELLKTGVRGKNGQYIKFSRIEPMSGTLYLQAEGETTWCDAGANSVAEPPAHWKPQKVLICFGPEHAPLEQRMVENAWQEARAFRPDLLLFCAFQFDEEAAKDIDELPASATGMQLLKVQMNADLLTDDLRKKRSSNESFWLIGQPEVELKEIKKGEHKGKYQVDVLGFDYYNPKTGNVESGGKHQIAMWMLDTNYDGRSLFPSQVFFPMAGASEGWATLARNLKAEIDEEKIEAFRGTESIPFEPGNRKCVAVKIVDDRGIESLKIIRL